MGDRSAASSGWTVADTSKNSGSRSNGSSMVSTPTLQSPNGGGKQSVQHVRWSKDVVDEGGGGGGGNGGGNEAVGIKKSRSEEDLDKLLEGLTELTETLPDLRKGSNDIELRITEPSPKKKKPAAVDQSPLQRKVEPPSTLSKPTVLSSLTPHHNQQSNGNGCSGSIADEVDSLSKGVNSVADVIRQAAAAKDNGSSSSKPDDVTFPSVRKTRQLLQSRDTYGDGGASGANVKPNALQQPYHTMENSKPFSYIPMNGSSRPGSRSSQQTAASARGLESPSLLRKIMGGVSDDADGGGDDFSKESTPPSYSTTITIKNGGGAGLPSASSGPTPTEMKQQLADLQQQQQKILLEQQQHLLLKQQQILQQQTKLSSSTSYSTTAVISPQLPVAVAPMAGTPQSLPTPSYTNYLLSKPGESDEEATMTWLERQQKKLRERKDNEHRRLHRNNNNNNFMMNELKTSLKTARGVSGETDGYASSEAPSQLFSEATSTRESSPIKPKAEQQKVTLDDMSTETLENLYKQMISMQQSSTLAAQQQQQQQQQQPLQASTPVAQYQQQPSYTSSLSRQMSESSYDRQRPFNSRRLRYDSESETELGSFYYASGGGGGAARGGAFGSNNSLDSSNMFHLGAGGIGGVGSYSLPGSRPITPAFPQMTLTSRTPTLLCRGLNNGRAGSPGAGSLYQGGPTYGTSRRGSISSEPADVAPQHVKLAKDNYKFWYKPNISREEAITILKHSPTGTFVVRDSNSFPGAFGLAMKVATPPSNAKGDDESDLVRHFLIEPTKKGVKLKGYANEPVFASLSALVYQHTTTQLALPVRLALPTHDLMLSGSGSNRDSIDSRTSSSSQMQQLLKLGAACNVLYLFTMDVDTLTGPSALKKAIGHLMSSKSVFRPVMVHFKVASQGITLTDTARKVFFRKHYNTPAISFCGLDPDDRRWKTRDTGTEDKMFGFVAKMPKSRSHNQCHVFAEHDPEQPSKAIVNFVNKVMLQSSTTNGGGGGGGGGGRADVV